MPTFNLQAFGQRVYVNFNQDISSATALEMTLQPQLARRTEGDGDNCPPGNSRPLIVTPILGTVDVQVEDELYLANQYVEYVTQESDFRDTGRWRKKAKVTLPSQTIAANYTYFRVMP